MSYKVVMKPDPEDEYGYRWQLEIVHNGEVIQTEYDGGEPEDNTFGRDWSWVPQALRDAYNLGVSDGYNLCHADYVSLS